MKRIKWFQRVMITTLIGVNSFVFMSMRDVSLTENISYTMGLIAVTILALSLISYAQKIKKRKASQTNKLPS
jgi:nicotinamide riboside transporter PnuC